MPAAREDRSGLGCLWLIGWTCLSLMLTAGAIGEYEDPAYTRRVYDARAPGSTWTPTPMELTLFGLWVLFWLGGIAAWHLIQWLRRLRFKHARSQ